jgi:hypothetical protein
MRVAMLAVAAGVAVIAPAAAAPAGRAPANLIQNGGFEQPRVQVGSYQLYGTGQSFAGWTVVGARGNVAPVSGKFASRGFSFPAKSGRQWLDLTGLSNSATGVAQTVTTTPGATYTLRFSVGNVVNAGGIYGRASTVLILVNGKRVLAARNGDGSGKSKQVWKDFAVTVKATSGATTVSFRNGDGRSDNDNGLDAVTLVRR